MSTNLTVIIPLYNASAYLRRCLESVIAQEEPADRIIVVDDGSTDDSAEIAAGYPQVTLVRQPNRGVADARNAGMQLASTTWVTFLDADDFWAPNHLTELAALRRQFPHARLLATSYRRWAEGATAPSFDRAGRRSEIRYFKVASRYLGVVHSSTVAVHRESLLAVGGFPDHTHGEDLACWALVALQHPVASSTAVTAVYRQGTGGAMSVMPAVNQWPTGAAPLRWQELSPSAGIVAAALQSGNHRCDPEDLRLYLDSRINSALRSQLLAGNAEAVGRLQALRIEPFRWQFAPTWAAEHLPFGPVASLAALRLRVRRPVARLRRSARRMTRATPGMSVEPATTTAKRSTALWDDGAMGSHHLVIAGTGRTGTTALVQLLDACGLATRAAHHTYDETARAGLESYLEADDAPYVIKAPYLSEDLAGIILAGFDPTRIDAIILPLRDLDDAVASRLRNFRQGGLTAHGGLWRAARPSHQRRLLTDAVHQLLWTAAMHSIPVVLLSFPKFVDDPVYACTCLHPLMSEMDEADLRKICAEVLRADLVRPQAPVSPLELALLDGRWAALRLVSAITHRVLRRVPVSR
jgi:hypothetical protein